MKDFWSRLNGPLKIGLVIGLLGALLTIIGLVQGNFAPLDAPHPAAGHPPGRRVVGAGELGHRIRSSGCDRIRSGRYDRSSSRRYRYGYGRYNARNRRGSRLDTSIPKPLDETMPSPMITGTFTT